MEMLLKTTPLHLETPLGQGSSQAMVEGEITLPGGLREESRLLLTDGMAMVEAVEAMQDRASVSGRVIFRAVYAQGEKERIGSVEAAADFTHLCDLQGAQPRSKVDARAQIVHLEGSITGTRLTLRAVVRVDARAVSASPVEVVVGMQDEAGIQTSTRQVTMQRTTASGSTDVLLREEFDLPASLQVRQTLFATAYPQVTEASGGQGSIGLTGQVLLEAVHATDIPGRPIAVTRHTLPLEQAVQVLGDPGEMLDGRASVKDVAVASQDAGDGACTMRVEVLLGLDAWAESKEAVAVLQDAYTLSGDDLRLARSTLPVRTGMARSHTAESGKTVLLLPEGNLPVRSVLAAFATPSLTNREQIAGRTATEGTLSVTLLYMTDDSESPVSVLQEVPFRQQFAIALAPEDRAKLTVTEVEATPVTSDRVELRYILHLDAESQHAEPVSLVTDVQPVASADPTGDIVLYFTQPGETLWDIARRYRVPVSSVRDLNPEVTGEPRTGQGVVVWRRCTECV